MSFMGKLYKMTPVERFECWLHHRRHKPDRLFMTAFDFTELMNSTGWAAVANQAEHVRRLNDFGHGSPVGFRGVIIYPMTIEQKLPSVEEVLRRQRELEARAQGRYFGKNSWENE